MNFLPANVIIMITNHERRITVKNNNKKNPFLDPDYDTEGEEDAFLDELEELYPSKTPEQILAEHSMTREEGIAELEGTREWLKSMLERIGAENCHKYTVCRGLCEYANKDNADMDLYELWLVCMSCYSDILFEGGGVPKADEAARNLLLWDDVDRMQQQFTGFRRARRKFDGIMKALAGSPVSCEPLGRVSLADVKAAAAAMSLSGEYLEDNLTLLTKRVNCSRELSSIAPLVFYSAFTRYTKKLLSSPDFDMNMKKAFSREKYTIDRDNGKNLTNFYKHINTFLTLTNFMAVTGDDILLNIAGFDRMSNIFDCPFISWEGIENIVPMEKRMTVNGFTCFIRGYDENYFFTKSKTDINDIMKFESAESPQSYEYRVKTAIDSCIDCNEDIMKRFVRAVRKRDRREYIAIANDIYGELKINKKSLLPEYIGIIQSVCISMLMERTDRQIIAGMTGLGDIFEDIAVKYSDEFPSGEGDEQ